MGCPTNNMTNMVACLQTANLTSYGSFGNALVCNERNTILKSIHTISIRLLLVIF